VPGALEHTADHVGQAGVIVHDQDARHQRLRAGGGEMYWVHALKVAATAPASIT
jgi:hypothetical protein